MPIAVPSLLSSAADHDTLRAILDLIDDPIFVKNRQHKFVLINRAGCALLDRSQEQVVGRTDHDLQPSEQADICVAADRLVLETGRANETKELLADSAGRTTAVLIRRNLLGGADGQVFIVANVREVPTFGAAQAQIRQNTEQVPAGPPVANELGTVATLQSVVHEGNWLRALIDRVPDLLFVKDTESKILVANDATAAGKTFNATGEPVTTASLVGKTDFDFFPREVAQRFREVEVQIMQSGQPMIDVLELNVDITGHSKWISMTKVPLRNAGNEVIGLLGIGRDVTARKLAEDRVQFLAHHDPLTGLPNRALFADRLGQVILHAKRQDQRVAVIYVDLDRFKLVNESLGHLAGDALLKITADRMVRSLRSTNTVARLGGDEFAILLDDPAPGSKGLAEMAEKLRLGIAAPVEISGRSFTVTASIGIASFPEDGFLPDELIAHADAALHRAKELGRDHFQFYSATRTGRATEHLSFAEDMRQALAGNEFVLNYQPQIDLKTGRIRGAEALVRWQHPDRGLVPPGRFIPLAEEIGLIGPIGKWVIETACAQNAQWQRDGLPPITVSVNVSARQFWNKDLVAHVKGALEKSRLAAKYLDLELTESMIMQDLAQAIATMHELKAIGVTLSIDDFGTGYSSLSALKSFPISRLKIDQSFIQALSHDEDDRAIVTAVISLGQKLKLRVIAEGVETGAQLALLRENECDEAQGFHFSRPLLPNDLADLLNAEW